MMTTTVTRRFQFCAGHRILGHESKCAHLHGHNYVALVTCEALDLDHLGRVIDFSVIKQVVGSWIDDRWDHGMILFDADRQAYRAVASMGEGQKRYTMKSNPTAENMARVLLQNAQRMLDRYSITVTKVVLWETENCYAEVTA